MAFPGFPTFYDWISSLPHPSDWVTAGVSYHYPSGNTTSTFMQFSTTDGNIGICEFVMRKNVVKCGILCFEFDVLFCPYREGGCIRISCRVGEMSFTEWEDNKMCHILAMLINYVFKDVYRVGDTQLAEFLVDLDLPKSSKYKDLLTTAFVGAGFRSLIENDVIKVIQSHGFHFPDSEPANAIMEGKLKFLSALGDDDTESLMLKVASIFAENNYMRTAGELHAEGYNPLVYSNSKIRDFWIIKIYTPVLLMNVAPSDRNHSGRPYHPLAHHQMRADIQFRCTVKIFYERIEVQVRIHNLQCGVIPLVPEKGKNERRNEDQRHFPSRILLSIGPQFDQSNILMFSLSQSSNAPPRCQLRPESCHSGCPFSGILQTLGGSCWKYEQSQERLNTGSLDWTLYDNFTGYEVVSTNPVTKSRKNMSPWFENGHSRVSCSPFTKKGGVVFTEDDGYGHPITWTVKRNLAGQTLKWHVRGSIWLTYWPMENTEGYWETVYHEFSQDLELKLMKSDFVTV